MASIKDPLTGIQFLQTRSNQRFQSPANRVKYHNAKAKHLRDSKSKVDTPLRINYNVLVAVAGDSKEKIVHKEFLRGKGFDFRFFTSHIMDNGKSTPAYYDFAIFSVADKPDYVMIQKLSI